MTRPTSHQIKPMLSWSLNSDRRRGRVQTTNDQVSTAPVGDIIIGENDDIVRRGSI